MKVIVTGAAGFIGSELIIKLLSQGNEVLGIDNHNHYYDPKLKESRIKRFINHPNYSHLRFDICDYEKLYESFSKNKPQLVVNLAAQAGVRFSIENPREYINSNIVGFYNIIECCRYFEIEHFVYASSSSVYGGNDALPLSISQNTNHPLNIYAATKKANELIAHAYSHLFSIPSTGLRFFTVYGPWGRPDMALFKFIKLILENKPIKVFNYGNHTRDFTYIDDIVEGIIRVAKKPAQSDPNWQYKSLNPAVSNAPWRIYNIGNNNPVKLLDCIKIIENILGKKAIIELLPMQEGDVKDTYADVNELISDFDFKPQVKIEEGIKNLIYWFREYYKI